MGSSAKNLRASASSPSCSTRSTPGEESMPTDRKDRARCPADVRALWEAAERGRSVVHRPSGPAGRDDELAAHGPRLVRRQEDREISDLRRVHHAADGVAARGIGGEVARLDLVGSDTQLFGAGGQQAWRALGARRPGVDAVDRDPEAAHLHGQGLGEVHQRRVARAAAEIAGIAGVGAADVDDAAPAVLLHVRKDRAGAAQRAHVLDVEVVKEILVDHGLDGAGGAGGAVAPLDTPTGSYKRAGSNGPRSSVAAAPSVISSARARPVAGALSIPHGPWPVATYAPATPGTRPISGRPSSVTGR